MRRRADRYFSSIKFPNTQVFHFIKKKKKKNDEGTNNMYEHERLQEVSAFLNA